MSGRPHGLIIAIEQYPVAGALPDKLAGTRATADAFRDWLVTTKGVAPADIVECVSDTQPAPQTTKREIVRKLKDMQQNWQNKVSELYVFMSGHGVLQDQVGQPMDYLLTSEFADFDADGNAALALQEMQRKLRESLGPGEHYYFVDFCRTDAPQEQISLSNLGLTVNKSSIGTASYYTLFSVRAGAVANVQSGFGAAVVDGLKGTGRAKQWVQQPPAVALYVTFDALLKFVQKRVEPQAIDTDRKGIGDGRILLVDPVVDSVCTIEVVAAAANEQFQLTIADPKQRPLHTLTFTGPQHKIPLKPDDYEIAVASGGTPLKRIEPAPPAAPDLFAACVVKFVKRAAAPPPAEAAVEIEFPAVAHARIIPSGAGLESMEMSSPRAVDLAPGDYTIEMMERGVVTERITRRIEPGKKPKPVRLGRPTRSRAHDAVRKAVKEAGGQQDGDPRLLDFSESLGGALANQDLTLWLTLLGASRIIRDTGEYHKLRDLKLSAFDDVAPHASPTYVIAGFEGKTSQVTVSSRAVKATKLTKVKSLSHIVHARVDTPPGPALLTLELAEANKKITLASHALPNRVTLIVIVHGKDGRWYVRQLLLPLWTHRELMPFPVRNSIEFMESLRTVHASVQAQTQFTRELDVQQALQNETGWLNLLYGKWLDPVMSLIACYELIRRGRKEEASLPTVLGNLREYFPGLADTEAIARLAGHPWTMPAGVPIFLDGAMAMPELLEEERGTQVLDYRAPWTMWIGPLKTARHALALRTT